MPSNPNFDDFDLENSSESGIDGLDEIGQTSEESPIYDDGPVFDGDAQNDGNAQDAETPFDGDEATSVSELADEELAETDDVGGAAIPTADEEEEEEEAKPKRRFPEMTVFEVMLILSFLFITLATIKLFYELNEFGDFPGSYPWRTSDS